MNYWALVNRKNRGQENPLDFDLRYNCGKNVKMNSLKKHGVFKNAVLIVVPRRGLEPLHHYWR